MSVPRLFAARSTRGGVLLEEVGVYGRERYTWLRLITIFLQTCMRLLTGLFARTRTLTARATRREVAGADKAEKTRLLEPTSELDEPESAAARPHAHQPEPDQSLRKSSVLLGERLPVPFACVQHAFIFQAHKYPSLPAVEHLGKTISYAQLDALSTRLAQRLHAAGVNEGARVLLLAHRSIAFVVGVLGTLKAGASYIPLDGGIVTDETLRTIIQDAEPLVVLCSRKYTDRVARWDVSTLVAEDILESGELEGTESNLNAELKAKWRPEKEAYVIYTSGTTGRPKGVSVSHANVTNCMSMFVCYAILHFELPADSLLYAVLCTTPGNLNIQPGMRVSQLLNIAFDMCAWEVLGCLANGGTLVLRDSTPTPTSSPLPSSLSLTNSYSTTTACPPGAFASQRDAIGGWLDLLKTVDVVIATPSILAKLDPKELRNVRTVAVAGEPCPQKLADEWAVGRSFYNCCGPTEVRWIQIVLLIPID